MAESTPVYSVITTLKIIEYLASVSGPMGVSEIANALDTTKPRVFRHLRTLLDQDYVSQDANTDKYQLTVKLFHIGQAIADQTDFLAEVRRVMPMLRAQVNLTVTVGQYEEEGVRVLDILKHRSEFEISARPGAFFDFHCSAQGKIALAFGPTRLWDKVKQSTLKSWTVKTNTDLKALLHEIKQIKKQGWAMAPEQVLSGINAVSVPVFDSTGSLVGMMTILGSIQFLPVKPEPVQIKAIMGAAAEVSSRLGYREVIAV